MARPLRIEYPGAFYHVMNRGLEYRKIYKEKQDYPKFLSIFRKAHNKYGVVLHAYCLMPNHYHLLLETPEGRLNQAMRHLDGVYTQYFNRRNKRVGPLFQGRYKAILVDADSYVLEVSRYIHMNPVKAGLSERPEQYPYSSMGVYTRKRGPEEWLKTGWLLERVSKREKEARKQLYKFTVGEVKGDWDPFKQALGGYLLGGDPFIRKIKSERVPLKKDGSIARLTRLQERDDLEDILGRIRKMNVGEKLGRKLAAFFMKKYTPLKLNEIGQRLGGMKESAVCRMVMRFEADAEKKKGYREAIAAVEKMSNVKT